MQLIAMQYASLCICKAKQVLTMSIKRIFDWHLYNKSLTDISSKYHKYYVSAQMNRKYKCALQYGEGLIEWDLVSA